MKASITFLCLLASISALPSNPTNNRNDKPVYIAKKTSTKPALDGTLSSEAWKSASFSDSFIDIRGTSHPSPPLDLDTKMKILLDDEFLYLGAVLAEKDVWSSISQKNDFVYRQKTQW